jgi:hypothetical protein
MFITFLFPLAFSNTRRELRGYFPEYGEESIRGLFLRGAVFILAWAITWMKKKEIITQMDRGDLIVTLQTSLPFFWNISIGITSNVTARKGFRIMQRLIHLRLYGRILRCKSSPNTTFQANVNVSTSNYNKYNAKCKRGFNKYINSSISFKGLPERRLA